MTKKEHTTITELFQVLDLLESLDMQFWLDGGWGVDVLYDQQKEEVGPDRPVLPQQFPDVADQGILLFPVRLNL